ncbi:MAG: mechanosensitive ion channel domain-containing protein [Desulfobacterales bacterium]
MKNFVKKILGVMLLITAILLSNKVLAQDHPQGDQPPDAKLESLVVVPELADIIPLATKLTGRLAVLENEIADLLDVSAVRSNYVEIEASLKDPAGQLQRLKESKEYRHGKLVDLREAIEKENKLFEKTSKPLSQAIRQLGAWRTEWLAEKKRWNEWQSALVEDADFDQLESSFAKATATIDTALNLLIPQLQTLLSLQEKAANIQVKIDTLAIELDNLIVDDHRDALLYASPPMLSTEYFTQFSRELSYALRDGLNEISWSGGRFFDRQGWILLIQGFLSLVVIIAVFRNRRVLNESKRWLFLAARPFSAGLFLGAISTIWFYYYGGAPAIWKLAINTVAGLSFARLSGGLVEASWKRKLVYGLMFVLIITELLNVLDFPLPLFRLYTILAALAGLLFCLRCSGESIRQKDSGFYTWSLRLGALFFAAIIVAELWGKAALAQDLLLSLIDSIATVLVFMLFLYMIHGVLEWAFRSSPLRRTTVLYKDPDAIIRRVARFIDVAICGLVLLPTILMIWGVYNSLEAATKGLLALGLNLGSLRISVGLLITSAGILYGTFLASWIVQKLLVEEVLARRRVETGVRVSIARLVHYVLIFVGFVLALLALGFEFTKLTIILSALGVGIGFGLQGVVNNFVSGLILLFERPVRVGDYIEIGGNWAEIDKIGLRATTVQTFDQADVIIPNADLITNQVTNWTLSNRRVRLIIPVGVAYGSDVPLVMETLIACAKTSSNVAKAPAPQVLFLSFGESSLDLELRVWVLDAEDRIKVKSELHQEIDRRFREAKIEIAFPQRDLHLRSLDESVTLQPTEAKT